MAVAGARKLSPDCGNLYRFVKDLLALGIGDLDADVRNLVQQLELYGQGTIGVLLGGYLLLFNGLTGVELQVAEEVRRANQLRVQITHFVSSHQVVLELP